MEVFFSLLGVDVNGKIINVASCSENLRVIDDVLRFYEVKMQDGFSGNNNSKFSIVDNPNDFSDIVADLKM